MALPSIQVISPAGEASLATPAAAERLQELGWTVVSIDQAPAESKDEAKAKKPAGRKTPAKSKGDEEPKAEDQAPAESKDEAKAE